ncbi:MAG: LacI family DNA-binding transcriptional regulator [Thermoflexales bacterium]|nr:LacI family DNA-binding transcriptional regulator [Thermoflexales bacterium]
MKRTMRRAKTTITIQDVAKEAGVSISTVSRVLNDKDDVALETYERIRGVIQRLGYTSSLAARSMRSRQTNVIGLIVPDVADSFSIQVMKGVNRAIAEFDYDLIIYTSGSIKRPTGAEREQHYVALLNGSITDGIVIATPAATSFSTAAPVVTVDPNNKCPNCPSVISTNYAGATAAMEYLIGLGHRRIGFINGRPDLQSASRRLQAYLDALAVANIPEDQVLIEVGDFTTETGRLCALRLLSRPEPPTAILAANDRSAIGAMEAARELGRRIPQDLSLVGFDNIPETAYLNPSLTTVDQFIDQMGYIATEILIGLIHGKSPDSEQYEIATQLVVRDSCQPLASNARVG